MKMHKLMTAALIVLMLIPMAASAADKASLTFGSWRTDDTDKINALIALFNKTNPDIEVKFDPTNPPDYNATLRLQLENGTGPDIFYARSYATGQDLFKAGFIMDVGKESFMANYSDGAKAPWKTADGKSFAMPFMAVSHGVYYNQKIFKENGIAVPRTWEDLMAAAQKLKAKNIVPFANGLKDEWDIAEVVWMNVAPGFIGGAEGRLAYESGKKPFNDAGILSVFQAMKDISPYLPSGFQGVDYNSSKAMFMMGKAAMMFDGSWTVTEYLAQAPAFEWSVFAVPAPKGKKSAVTFHPDAGIAINAKTKNAAAAKTFIAWLSGPEASKFMGDNLVGFFPMVKTPVTLSNAYANTFLGLNKDRLLDVRFTWPVLMVGTPSAYDLIMNGSIAVISGKKTPKQAADEMATGLAQWYKPAK